MKHEQGKGRIFSPSNLLGLLQGAVCLQQEQCLSEIKESVEGKIKTMNSRLHNYVKCRCMKDTKRFYWCIIHGPLCKWLCKRLRKGREGILANDSVPKLSLAWLVLVSWEKENIPTAWLLQTLYSRHRSLWPWTPSLLRFSVWLFLHLSNGDMIILVEVMSGCVKLMLVKHF